MPADLVAFWRGDARDGTRHGRVHAQAFLEYGAEVGELSHGDIVNIALVLECGPNFVDEFSVRVRVVQEVKGQAAEEGGCSLGPGDSKDRSRAIDFVPTHALLVVVSQDVGNKVWPVNVFA